MRRVSIAAALGIVLTVAACSSGGSGSVQAAPSAGADLVAAAKAAASTAAEGKRPAGTVHLLGLLSGDQLKQYLATFKPFEDATGIQVKYETTADLFTVLQTRLAGGSPPDVVSDPSAGQLRQLAEQGKLVPIDSWLDMAAVRGDFPAGLLGLASTGGHLYGLFYNTSLQNLVWYDPKHYDGPKPPGSWTELEQWTRQQAAAGKTPWCVGVESGSASGWPGAAWIEQFVLRQSGATVYDSWWQGTLPWSSPEIKDAFRAFGQIATDAKMVTGGSTAVLTTSFNQSPQGLYASPPRCALTVQADWLGNTLAQTVPNVKPVEDIDFFTFPKLNDANAGLLETSGELLGTFTDTPQTRAFMRYVATPQFAALVASTGQWLSANKKITADGYSSALSKRAAQAYLSAPDVRYAAQAAMPTAMETAFFSAVLDYVKNPGQLDAILAGMDSKRAAAYQAH
jgi:alpha-glucoside transport system substrate-binding protein